MKISIAGLPVEWQNENSDYVKSFGCDSDEAPVISVRFETVLPSCHGIQYAEKSSEHFLRLENGEFALADSEWSSVTAYYPTETGEYALPLAAICSRFSFYGAVLFHAACVDCGGRSVLFTGFSGVGKTTQAELWQKYADAEIINGDKAFLREVNGKIYGCGLPWKGSSEYCLNKMTELAGIVILRQSKENKITRLDALRATELMMPHAFLPHWDEICLNKAIDTFEKILGRVPVYLLECRPDKDAVRLTYDTVF